MSVIAQPQGLMRAVDRCHTIFGICKFVKIVDTKLMDLIQHLGNLLKMDVILITIGRSIKGVGPKLLGLIQRVLN